MTGIHRYDERRPFEPWLFSIARHLAIDHLRKVSPESLDEPSATGEPRVASLKAEEPGNLERLLDRERRAPLLQPCAACGATARRDFAFCPQCGSPLPRICPSCRRPVEPVWPHCAHCGQKLHAQPEGSIHTP